MLRDDHLRGLFDQRARRPFLGPLRRRDLPDAGLPHERQQLLVDRADPGGRLPHRTVPPRAAAVRGTVFRRMPFEAGSARRVNSGPSGPPQCGECITPHVSTMALAGIGVARFPLRVNVGSTRLSPPSCGELAKPVSIEWPIFQPLSWPPNGCRVAFRTGYWWLPVGHTGRRNRSLEIYQNTVTHAAMIGQTCRRYISGIDMPERFLCGAMKGPG